MGLFDSFNKRSTIKKNQREGKDAERIVRRKLEAEGGKVEKKHKGSDFKVTKTNPLTGEKKIKYVEVKSGNAKLSKAQKRKQNRDGDKYEVVRVNKLGMTETTVKPKRKRKPKSFFQ